MLNTATIFAHLMLFAIWLGGVRGGRNAMLASTLLLPTGLELAAQAGLSTLAPAGTLAIWAVSLVWLVTSWFATPSFGQIRAQTAATLTAQRVETVCRYTVLAIAAAIGIASALGHGPLATPWLGLKATLLALCLVVTSLARGLPGALWPPLVVWSLLALCALIGIARPG